MHITDVKLKALAILWTSFYKKESLRKEKTALTACIILFTIEPSNFMFEKIPGLSNPARIALVSAFRAFRLFISRF